MSFPRRENEKVAASDFLIPALILVLLQAQLRQPLATIKYMRDYAVRLSMFDLDEFNRVTLDSCINYLLSLDSDTIKSQQTTQEESK